MIFESVLILVPAIATMVLAAAVIYIGYAAMSCSVARMQGKECHTC